MNPLQRVVAERVGRQIRKARKQCGLSHDKLAARVGTSRSHLIKLEKGAHMPRPEMLSAIACETGKTEAFFVGDDDDEEEDAPLSRDEMDLYLSLHARVQRQVQRMAESADSRS